MARFYPQFVRIVVRLLPFLLAYLRDRRRFLLVGPSRRVSGDTHRERAARLRETLLELGPTFVKIGQVLSVRPDLVPKVYRDELSTLQDTVPPGAGGDPRQVLRAEIGDEFDDVTELAGGSLAYVYRATYDGADVAIKVQRPGIEARIRTDLHIVHVILPLVVHFVPDQYEYSLRNLADDFERVIFEELDFAREAEVMSEVRENFADDDRVYIPDVYHSVSSERVVTMEYVEGIKISAVEELEAAGYDPRAYARRVLQTYLQMGLEHGVFQADPHPGNLAVDDDGRLVIYDFGMSARLTSTMQSHILDLYRAIAERDVDRLMDTLIALDVLDPDVDRASVGRVLTLFIRELEGKEELTWRDIVGELGRMLHDFPFRIPPDVMLLIRVGSVGEGVCRELDPEFDFISEVRAYLRERGHIGLGVQKVFEDRRKELEDALGAALRLPPKVEGTVEQMAETDRQADERARTSARILGRHVGIAVVTGALFVTAALLTAVDVTYGAVGFVLATVSLLAHLWLIR